MQYAVSLLLIAPVLGRMARLSGYTASTCKTFVHILYINTIFTPLFEQV